MTLQEFIEQHDTHSFVKRNLEKMNECIFMQTQTHGKEFEDHLRQANNYYFTIYGYLYATYGHGDISDDDCESLVNELMELFKAQK